MGGVAQVRPGLTWPKIHKGAPVRKKVLSKKVLQVGPQNEERRRPRRTTPLSMRMNQGVSVDLGSILPLATRTVVHGYHS